MVLKNNVMRISDKQIAKLPADGGSEFNRLIFEKSPYLFQHARNPVDWYPWGEPAFEKAKKEDKPLFLSIGYSTCHWCHVMEHESFEDPQVAALMNEHFVSIKVDREERPDIDQIYMIVCQALTGGGGWPLTIIMTPDKHPFFAGTYFPKESRYQRVGMMDLLPRISELWKSEREKIFETAGEVIEMLRKTSAQPAGNHLDESILQKTFEQMQSRFDERFGGFGMAPKFPSPHNLMFLLRYWRRTGENRALDMVEKTLHRMRLGGIFDHVGYGFHRYSTDQRWLLPHFEKMLYDQAMLAMAYVETWQATGNDFYAQTAHEIFSYVLRDMTSPEGGFYSAEDANSEGEEGRFYVWTESEWEEILGREDAALFGKLFNLQAGGNFNEEATGEPTGRNIPHLLKPLSQYMKDLEEPDLEKRWEAQRKTLFNSRKKRIHPLKDDKILTDWNGLMIAALAKAAAALNKPEYANAAGKAARFIWRHLRDSDGRLLKRYRQGAAGLPAHVDDYAFMVWGLLELYESTFEIEYLHNALALNNQMLHDFWDNKHGGLFFTALGQKDLLVRSKEIYDGAIPSGNSVAAMNLLRIGRITADPEMEEKAMIIGAAFSKQVSRVPMGYAQLISALLFYHGPSYEVVISGKTDTEDTKAMLSALNSGYFPNKVVLFRPAELEEAEINQIAPFTRQQIVIGGKATAYVCKNYACNRPTTDTDEMLEMLGK
jgi:hypothetical protein